MDTGISRNERGQWLILRQDLASHHGMMHGQMQLKHLAKAKKKEI